MPVAGDQSGHQVALQSSVNFAGLQWLVAFQRIEATLLTGWLLFNIFSSLNEVTLLTRWLLFNALKPPC